WRFKERNTHHSAFYVITELPVVKQRRSVILLRQIGPMMSAYLPLCAVPARIAVGGALDMAEAHIVGCPIGMTIQIKAGLRQTPRLVPNGLSAEIDFPFVCFKHDILNNSGAAYRFLDTQNR